MATRSDPNSGLTDWAELYGSGHGQAVIMNNSVPDLAAINTASSGSGMTGPAGSPPSHGNSIEAGRVGKSPRRRSRASRRAPVTLLNTDTNNFRAMVQQFTGIPSGPYTSAGSLPGSSGASGPTISFGLDFGGPLRPSGGVMSFGQLQPQPYHQPRPQPPFQEQMFSSQQQQQHQYQYGNMFSTGEFSSGGGGNSNNSGENMFVDDGMFAGAMSGAQLMPKVTNSAATNIRGDHGFFG